MMFQINKLWPVLFLTGWLLSFTNPLSAQILKPVSWEVSAEKTGNNEYTLIYKAKIEDGWKVYANDIEPGGPIPTTINYDQLPKGVSLKGELQQLGKKEEAVEPLFDNMLLKFFKKRVTFRQVVTITQDATLSGYLEFMACDDRQCLAPEAVDFSFKLEADETGTNGSTNLIPGNNTLLEPVKWKIYSEKVNDTIYKLHFDATIDNGWKLYGQSIPPKGPTPTVFYFSNKGKGYQLDGKVKESANVLKMKEPLFDNMLLSFFKHDAQFTQTILLTDTAAVVNGYLEFMTCDASQCLPADRVEFSIDLKSGKALEVIDTSGITEVKKVDFGIDTTPFQNCGDDAGKPVEEEPTKGILSIFFLGFIGGLLALVTPCVFPMIPLTVSFFTKRSQNRSRGIFEALFYSFSIVLIFALLALPFVVFKLPPDTLNAISTNVVLNVVFFVVFLAFAFSFFGYYELTLPNSWLNKADNASNVGGLVGIFFMALTLALVSFSCTGPILGSLLVGTLTSDGGQMNLLVGMVGFGVALALPFGLFAAFPQMMNKLPKSGGWLNSVKVVLGFLEVALAFKFFSNADLVAHWGLLKREVFFAIWALCGLGIVAYLMGWIRFPHDSPGKPKFSAMRIGLAIVFLVLSGYFGYGVVKGSNPKLASGLAPPMFYSIYEQDSHCPLGLNCFHDWDEALAYAQEVNKPIMIDFTGWACVNCRKMEEHVWPEKEVYDQIANDYVLVSLYVDDKEMLPEDEQYVSAFSGKKIRTVGNKWSDFQSSYFGINSQPYYVLISPNGKVLNTPVPYTPDVQEYADFLTCGVEAYKSLTATALE